MPLISILLSVCLLLPDEDINLFSFSTAGKHEAAWLRCCTEVLHLLEHTVPKMGLGCLHTLPITRIDHLQLSHASYLPQNNTKLRSITFVFHSSSVLNCVQWVCAFNLCNITIMLQVLPNLSCLHNKMATFCILSS